MVRRMSVLALSGLCVLALAMPAFAGERDLWKHSAGAFLNTQGNDWVEKAPDGSTYYFKEQKRTEDFVLLYDRSRDCYVRLFNDRCLVKFGSGSYDEYYRGRWRQ